MVSSLGGENLPLPLLDVNEFSELGRLLRVTTWVKRFADNSKSDSTKLNGPMCSLELKESMWLWIKSTQLTHYGIEYAYLLSKNIINKESQIINMNSKFDYNDLLCLKGCLYNSQMSMVAPIILGYFHGLINLISYSSMMLILKCIIQVLIPF
ncbi:integrase catalytic domain-containing protein [Nephila pilipes]|uniref:Integrase catalytic domain-containing protein n=1 Tax=Nephila pilipes TaxID=299642 RepID=A0A8X6TT52_NEPPI|nr:integrase catalytic domain-containing protein [Nephila pilipes]